MGVGWWGKGRQWDDTALKTYLLTDLEVRQSTSLFSRRKSLWDATAPCSILKMGLHDIFV